MLSSYAGDVEASIVRAGGLARSVRRRLHRVPEVGLDLPVTQSLVLGVLSDMGIPTATGSSLTSVVGVVRGRLPGRTVLLRADMDGLPVAEETGSEFASEHPGIMHACGHDLHTAGLLGAAAVLAAHADRLRGTVVLMFQPGEEGWFGARRMIEEGVLRAPAPDVPAVHAAFAMHVNPWYPVGTVHLRSGTVLAAADTFAVELTGRAGHGSAPHAAVDPIPAVCELVGAIQAMVARTNPPYDPAVVSVTSVQAGAPEATSAIPERARIAGTVRTLSRARREEVLSALSRLAEGVAAAHGVSATVSIDRGYPATVNDDATVRRVRDVFARRIPAGVRELPFSLMGSEDFSFVIEEVPGILAFVGTTPEDELDGGWPADNHSPRVRYDERALDTFIRAHLAFVESESGDHT